MPSRGMVHVVDDDTGMRESLVVLLEDAGYRVRAHASAEELLAASTLSEADCIVSDVRMPGMDGLALLHRLRANSIALPLVLITGHGDIPLAVAAMKAGAVDFLEKPFEAKALLTAVETGLRSGRRDTADSDGFEAARRGLQGLTQREQEVLQHIVAGDSNKIVAEKLSVSPRTIEFHRAHIMDKTGARGLPDLVRLWLTAHPS